MKVSDSQLAQAALRARRADRSREENPYWLGPFENYKTFCPYLVGSYDRVADELARYIDVGFGTFILDIPPSEEELDHTAVVFVRPAADRRVDAAASGLRLAARRSGSQTPSRSSWAKSD